MRDPIVPPPPDMRVDVIWSQVRHDMVSEDVQFPLIAVIIGYFLGQPQPPVGALDYLFSPCLMVNV